jgi:anti-sigma B factor antagonist
MAPELKSEMCMIVENGEKNMLLDLTSCKVCDTSGMSALLLGNRLCMRANGKFVLCGLSHQIREMIDLAGLESPLTITYTREEAAACFA